MSQNGKARRPRGERRSRPDRDQDGTTGVAPPIRRRSRPPATLGTAATVIDLDLRRRHQAGDDDVPWAQRREGEDAQAYARRLLDLAENVSLALPCDRDDGEADEALVERLRALAADATAPDGEAQPASEGKRPDHARELEQMLRRYAAILLRGKTGVIDLTATHPLRTIMKLPDFRAWYAERWFIDKNHKVRITDLWCDDRRRRKFNGTTFDPAHAGHIEVSGDAPVFNTWKGFAVEPDADASCSLFLAHTLSVICAGDEEHYRWLMAWLAHMIQHPRERVPVAVSVIGEQGCGKSLWGDLLGIMLGDAYYHLDRSDLLTARFNAEICDRLLIVGDEAIFAPDPRSEGRTKTLISEKFLTREMKYFEAEQVPNFARLIFFSNEDHVVRAGPGERRHFILRASAQRCGDQEYFAALAREMNEGGAGALLHHLRHLDIDGGDLRNAPITDELLANQAATDDSPRAWWRFCIDNGRIPHLELNDLEADFHEDDDGALTRWPTEVRTDSALLAYCTFCRQTGVRILGSNTLGKRLRRMCPSIRRTQLTDREGERYYAYELPDLATCRRQFATFMNRRAIPRRRARRNG